MPDQSRLAKRTPRTLDTYVQAAIDANTSPTPSAVKRPRRRRKKRQEETSNPLPLYQQTAVTQTTPPAPAKIKRRKRKTKLKNAILQDGKTLQRCKFLVRGLVTAEDLEDEDEAEEVEAEVRADFERFGLKEIVIVKKAKTGFLVGDVTATFQDAATAALAFDAFNNKVFGGKTVTCVWKMRSDEDNVVVVINGMLTPEELEDPDEVADVEEEMMQILTKYGEVTELWLNEIDGEVTVSFSDKCDAEKVVQVMNGSRYGGRDVAAHLEESKERFHSDGEDAARSRKTEMKRVVTPIVQLTELPELQTLVGLFLKRLAALQERAYAQNKAVKRSRRLVLGMHEVRRGLLCNKIVLLIIATDLDGCEAVEEKYRELVAIAKEHKVPIHAPVNRRKLGKMLHKSVRVSCVGVYSIEGANDLFQQILQNVAKK
ncbi:Ribosomal protein L7Ae/L30e/S12e/Gadd45 family [Phytophthora infestans]|uniref:Ribosomal protein L7Ae/L30e/S12e/Gadd45 family n=1 Tax=Phytophthora infestans TaxID=4787 RepID=A0A8S9URH2_PHYIN|nr:Ribosomal protein L7Ae/L30e/S12e/Gadd45 family [Phytophthora infestans]